jgi:hypothetical protein
MRFSLLVLLSIVSLGAGAQEEQPASQVPDDWYRVELLIFANSDPEAALSESWSLLPELDYPEHYMLLREDGARMPADRPVQLTTVEQSVPGPVFDLAWDTSIEQLLANYQDSLQLRSPSVELEPLFELDVPVPWALLPPAQREFGSERRKLDRRRDLEVLYHESWLQPFREQALSLPIAIDGGPSQGDFSALQGSILLYRARYLHVATRLWLNTDGSYLANDSVMPAPPLPRARQEFVLPAFDLQAGADWLSLPQAPADEPIDSEDLNQDMDQDMDMDMDMDQEEGQQEELQAGNIDEVDSTPLTEAELQAFLAQPNYAWRHAVLLQQKRRMRGGELHYIDHPMLGVLIKVTRHEFKPFVEPEAELNRSLAETR